MYKNFYGFRDMPFSLTVNSDPDFVYSSQNYAMELPILISSLDRNITLTLVLGEKGVGKTTFINYVCSHLQQDSNVNVKLINARIESTEDFFQQILASFDQDVVDSTDDYEMLLQLSFFLNTKFKQQDRQSTLLIIDDADSMAVDALKGIELLLGLNTENNQVLQLILVGQHKLEKLLNKPSLRGILQNTKARCLLDALSLEETQQYIDHRISLAGVQDRKLFDEQVCSVIYEDSKGIPAKINSICDEALSRSSKLQKSEIDPVLIREVAKDQSGVPEKRNVWVFSSTLILAVTGIALALIFLPNIFISPSKDPQTEPSSILENLPVNVESKVLIPDLAKTHQQREKPEKLVKKKVLIEKKQQNKISKNVTIETRLATAERQFAKSRLSTPKGDNAYETYVAILKVTPNEKRALEGVQRIVKQYLELAKKQFLKGNLSKSQGLISRGLKISPGHEELIILNTQINIKVKQVERQNKIKALYKQAEQQIDTLQFTRPLNNNAYKTYQNIAALDKSNSQAKYGILKILARLKSQVQEALNKEHYTKALEITKEITKLSLKGKSDPFHKESIFTALETRNIIDKHLKNLLGQAEKQQKTQKYTYPSGDNALESYNKVLQIDPLNKNAKKGLDWLIIQYHKLVKAAVSEGKTDLAIVIANEGLQAFPEDSELLSLRSKVIFQQETAVEKADDSINGKKLEDQDQDQELKNFGTF